MLAELLCFGHSRSEVKLGRASSRAASEPPSPHAQRRGGNGADGHNGGGGIGGGSGGGGGGGGGGNGEGVAGNIDIALTAPVAEEAYDIAV